MSDLKFDKPFTQQEPIDPAIIDRVGEILQSGRLHRYNTLGDELSEASLLEQEYARYQGAKYCLACASGGYALHVALKAAGLLPGQKVLANAYTLAPVPGAIHNAGGVPVFVEIGDDWHIDTDDLAAKAESSGAKFLMLSHMRGHIGDMDAIVAICEKYDICMIEDCAHTMGARWKGTPSGNFGKVACFSTQTYKHINSGEGGLLTTDDPEIAAKAIIFSGSYMLYERHGAAPGPEVFDQIKLEVPNYSGRMDNLRAAILRGQLANLPNQVDRWNKRYQCLERALKKSPHLNVPVRAQHEAYVGSSFQFQVMNAEPGSIGNLVSACARQGVEIKWFGEDKPKAFTSRYDSWQYFDDLPSLPRTDAILSRTCDMRVPLTFTEQDCSMIGEIITQQADNLFG